MANAQSTIHACIGVAGEDVGVLSASRLRGAFDHDDMRLALGLGDRTVSMADIDTGSAEPIDPGAVVAETIEGGPEARGGETKFDLP